MVGSETSGLSEKIMLEAVKFGHESFIPIVTAIESLAKKAAKPKWEVEEIDHSDIKKKISSSFEQDLKKKLFKKLIKRKDLMQFLRLTKNVKKCLLRMKM